MDLTVLAQPYRESASSGQTFLTTAFGDPDVSQVLVVTAWLRESGMELLAPTLETLRERGGKARLLFGVDLKGTTIQGVTLARKAFSDTYVVHDPSGRTFHPKMYLALGEAVGYALIGSNNLSAGGLWHNYEAGVMAVFDPRREPELSEGIRSYAQRVLKDKAICKRVTNPVLKQLLAEGWLADEAKDRQRRSEDRLASTGWRKGRADSVLFQRSEVEKRGRPAPTRPKSAPQKVPSRARRRLATEVDAWWKPLGAGDAQHPPVGNATGNVALTHIPSGQDRATFFRRVFFGAERWRRSFEDGKRTDLATITAEVEIGGETLGRHTLTVVHRPYRATRGRATTVLRWGETLLEELRARDLTDWYLLLERADIGNYRLRITQSEPA